MSALVLKANSLAVKTNMTVPFGASGGTSPYTYVVVPVPGNVMGTIDGDGLYTSPNLTGTDLIRVTDNVGATANLKILVGTALELFCDVMQREMQLANDQVYLWDQKITVPSDFRLYIAVGILSCKPFANTNRPNGSGPGLLEVQSTNFQATLSVDIMSRGPAARDRKEEIILALNSTYAEQQQELNSFYIGKISSGFVNLSEIDGSAIPYRFNISVNVQYMITKTSSVAYFNTFQSVEADAKP